jgi:superfamily I DNA and/or RNA helicase
VLYRNSPLDLEEFSDRVHFIDLPNSKESKEFKSTLNKGEALETKKLVLSLKSSSTKPLSIGIITPYKAQVNLLKEILPELKDHINTVDAFQGQERDIIIFNCVRNNHWGDIGFVRDQRRMNVAITRAKHYLFILGAAKTLYKDQVWSDMINDIKVNGTYKRVQ